MAVRSHSTACDDGSFSSPKESIAHNLKNCIKQKNSLKMK